ncbi:MAG: hypothetical protein AAGF59_15760, partial [Pseudomonadota bacterium]
PRRPIGRRGFFGREMQSLEMLCFHKALAFYRFFLLKRGLIMLSIYHRSSPVGFRRSLPSNLE